MALADVLRERVSRRGRTAEVACGLLGTVTVEALPPRECAALGLRDGGRALLYAACRDLQTAGETLRREGRLFTPAEVTAYVSDEEAAAAARTVLALSGVTTDGDGASTKSAEVRLGDVRKPDGTAEDGQVSHEFFGGDGSERTDPILGGVSDFVPQNLALSEENDRFSAPLELSGNTEEVSGRGSNLHETESEVGEAVHETKSEFAAARRRGLHESKSEVEETLHEMKSESAAARREGLHESKSEVEETLHEMKSELTTARRGGLHESRSEVGEPVHETKSESAAARRRGLHESKSEVEEAVHEMKSESAAARRRDLHETESEAGEAVHESKSESVERFAEGLLEGLRRAAAVR